MGLYQQLVDKMFLDQYEDRPGDGFFHPSSLSGCYRMTVYEMTDTEPTEKKDIRNIRIMGNGTHFHNAIQEVATATFPGFLTEVKVEWAGVKGSADALMQVGDGLMSADSGDPLLAAVYELQEFKSIGPFGKKFLKGQPKPEHVKQARMYYWALENMGYLMDGIRIVYFDRDDWSVLEFEVEPWGDEEAFAFEQDLGILSSHVDEGTLPDRLEPDAWLCRYCMFKTRCWEVDGDNTRG